MISVRRRREKAKEFVRNLHVPVMAISGRIMYNVFGQRKCAAGKGWGRGRLIELLWKGTAISGGEWGME